MFRNPYRPGAGHPPPYLAGREEERSEFLRLLDQEVVFSNLLLTGLRGVGKTVLLDTFKPLALEKGWLWAGADLSESTTVAEDRLAIRILTDLAVATSNFVYDHREVRSPGFGRQAEVAEVALDFPTLRAAYDGTRGLTADRLKGALLFAWYALLRSPHPPRGVVFAYDEAQNMADRAERDEFPLSVMLDVFQSVQRQGVPFLLVLTGLPTLLPRLIEARTYTERMFRVLFLDRLDPADARDAIVRPVQKEGCPITFTDKSIRQIERHSAGYPYFIQFICREAFDALASSARAGVRDPRIPIDEITAKLDSDFFAGRWSRVTDRQRDLLFVVSMLDSPEREFTVQEIVQSSKRLPVKGFSPSHASQILAALIDAGVVYRNRHGKYSFAVPLFAGFIRRQHDAGEEPPSDPVRAPSSRFEYRPPVFLSRREEAGRTGGSRTHREDQRP
ncbi:MAG: AAA family ATPase [Gammaproteobacteria bacterium]|nr:AAA family ATPase [Gammaproteobacteria bacterium]